MNMTLKRTDATSRGIFGELQDEAGKFVAFTLEHAYEHVPTSVPPVWEPKLPPGVYTCVRGQHQLHSGPIETFEVTGVPDHKGILLHPGNTEDDSEGCILLGLHRSFSAESEGSPVGISSSREAFNKFMDMQAGKDEFTLAVVGQ